MNHRPTYYDRNSNPWTSLLTAIVFILIGAIIMLVVDLNDKDTQLVESTQIPSVDTTSNKGRPLVHSSDVSIELLGKEGWRTPTNLYGTSPLQVLEAVEGRLSYEQTTTEFGSDENAKALVAVLEAIQILSGRPTKVGDLPLIE